MIITCEQCQARFKLADEKLKAEGTKVRCSKCQSIFTVFPPPPVPEKPVDAGDFSLPPVSAGESTPTPAPDPTATESAPGDESPETEPGGQEFAFGEQDSTRVFDSVGEEFSFAGTTSADSEAEHPTPPGEFAAEETTEPTTVPGEFDFDSAFAEEPGTSQSATAPVGASVVEFDFGQPVAETETGMGSTFPSPGGSGFAEEVPTDTTPGEFAFDDEPLADPAPGEFTFNEEPATADTGGFDSDTGTATIAETSATVPADKPNLGGGTAPPTSFGEISFGEESAEEFAFDSQAVAEAPAFGGEDHPWGEPGGDETDSFNFEEPKFESQAESTVAKPADAGLSFGEIDFSDGDETGEPFPSFDNEPNFAQPPSRPEVAPPPPPPPPPVQRQPASRPRSEGLEPPPAPRHGPLSKMVVGLGLLLIVLCGAGAYLFMSGNGERLIGQLIMKIKGEEPTGPVEQRIGLNISGSSYVNNREAGQLLVVQGTAANNFSATRSAISVKGLILDAAGKTIQQQTVFCGNYLSEDRLQTLKYAEIEETMSNQFGDSLANMNVKPGTALRFTIIFRNVPKEMANISVEVVDSKPGGS